MTTATLTYRQAELARAKAEWKKARHAWDTATTRKAKNKADEDLQFWGNKVAFLENIRHGAFEDEK